MYIYGDVVIVLNFIMNSLILLLSAYIAGREFRWGGVWAAALLGSFYALGEILPRLALFYTLPAKLAIAAAMVYLTFGYKTARAFGLITAIFFIVSFILGGAVIGWFYFWQDKALGENRLTPDFIILTGGVFLAAVLIFLAGRWISDQVFRRKNSYLFTVRYRDREFTGAGFLDTGNSLYSPVGRRPVILLTKEACLQVLPDNIADYFKKNTQDNWIGNLADCQDEKWLSSVEIIPYMAVGSNDVLLGFRPDQVVIFDKEGKVLSSSQVVVAITNMIFNENGDCSALLHPALMNQGHLKKEAGVCGVPGQ